jgi:hypothetical protein
VTEQVLPDVAIRLAVRADVPKLHEFEGRFYVGNLSESERADGFISVWHSVEWFTRAVDSGGIHVAVTDGDRIGGFIAVVAPPDPTDPDIPEVTRGMVQLARTVKMNGRPIADQRYALRGPVCISPELRGRGVYSAFNAVTLQAYRDRYDIGVLFVSADNPRSLHTTTGKLGATDLAMFDADGKRFHFLAFEFPSAGV